MIHSLGIDFSEDSPADQTQAASAMPAATFKPGTVVVHQLLGEGVVQSFNDVRGSCEVRFANGSIRNIRTSFLQRKS